LKKSNISDQSEDNIVNLYINNDDHKINVNTPNTKSDFTRQFSDYSNKEIRLSTNIKFKAHPYQKAIDILNNLNNTLAPYEKIRVISNISKAITESIDDYWKNFYGLINKSQLVLEADDLMSIFIYILIKSQQIDTIIHLNLIKDFTTKVSKSTMAGYYYCTLEAALMYILSVDNIEEIMVKEKKNSGAQDNYNELMINIE